MGTLKSNIVTCSYSLENVFYGVILSISLFLTIQYIMYCTLKPS